MKASENKFLKFLQTDMQCLIPLYQRTYSWQESQCDELWTDIVNAGTNEAIKSHFVGSVVYVQDGIYQASATPQLSVIDGQQRLTTTTLILLALAATIDNRGGTLQLNDVESITAKKIRNLYICNPNEDGPLFHKLILTQSDRTTLLALVNGEKVPEEYSKRVLENFEFFLERLEQANLADVYKGLQKLMIVDISLDRGNDNPQLIFESLNSTGLKLSQADLIRNYVLMDLPPEHQSKVYREFWFPIEKRFGHAEYTKLFDRFMRDYLTLKLGRIPNIDAVYQEFKIFSLEKDVDSLVKDIDLYSQYFVNIALEKEPKPELLKRFVNLNELKVDVIYPFLLEVYSDFVKEVIEIEVFKEILDILESYVFRRAICEIPTNALNKTFATLYKEIDTTDYLNSFKASLMLKDAARRYPNDDEFIRKFQEKDVYNFRNKNYLLTRLENSRHSKEPVNVGDYTIEHILPQNSNLSDSWRFDLGESWKEVQSKYLHTIGNLTLTGYNSELSDRPFKEKQSISGGFKSSNLFLNRGLGDLDAWNESEITKRASELSNLASKVWLYPSIDELKLEAYRNKRSQKKEVVEYTLDNYEHLKGDMLNLYKHLEFAITALDPSISVENKKLYIAFKTDSNFVDVVPQKSRLRLSLNVDLADIKDPKNLCEDVSGKGRWGNGNTQLGISKIEDIEYAMFVIKQAYEASL
ncbi:DUF262 domain-containing protein [Polynucleobacter paneuropaeus]|uniref:DUF262 domain-containing protein n=1 Tax=Polynucleobacter paneuropaeus TaxID=2527775 RepID=A0A9Q2WGV4_9BURK|nr:DUF262 domain-containing protein [Polynucleobacter paneuropaeus]